MSQTEIRAVLTEIHQAVEVPPVDRVAFQTRVRGARRRRTTGRALLGAAAAVALAASAWELAGVDNDSGRPVPATEAPQTTRIPLRAPVWFVRDHRLTALDPDGRSHGFGTEVESVVGWTTERVYAVATDGHLVVADTRWDAERQDLTFEPVAAPTDAVVGGAVLSGDGRYLAWIEGRVVTVRDEKADRDQDVPTDPNTAVVGVGPTGVLLSEDGDLMLRDGSRTVDVPTALDGYGVAATVAQHRVLVPDRDGRSRLYDVSGDSARLVETFPGVAVLGPYGERVAVVDDAALSVWDGGHRIPVIGLDGVRVSQVRWADETLLLVEGSDASGSTRLYGCDVELACTELPGSSGAGLQ